MSAETRPCPKCGCTERPWAEIDARDTDNLKDYRECPHCHARTESFDDPDDALAAWQDGLVKPG